MDNTIDWTYLTQNKLLLLVLLFLFSLSPFLFLLVLFIYGMNKLKVEDNDFILLLACITGSIMVSAVNAVKIPENDLIWYVNSFHLTHHLSFFECIKAGPSATGYDAGKEPMYCALVWFLSRLTFDNDTLFKFALSLINYTLLTFSTFIYGKHMKLQSVTILCGIFLMCFIPYIFTMSLQLLRQFTAGSILVMLAVLKSYTKISPYWIYAGALSMVLIHSTALFYLPFLLLPAFQKEFEDAKWWYLFVFVGILALQKLAASMLGFMDLGGDNSVSMAMERAASGTNKEFGRLSFTKLAMIISIACSAWFAGFRDERTKDSGIKLLSNLCIFLCIFIVTNLDQSELAIRMFFYLFPFVPLLLMPYFEKFRIPDLLILVIGIVMLFFWSQYLHIGVWTYELPMSVFICPIELYLI